MKFNLSVELDNDAFFDENGLPSNELVMIINKVANDIKDFNFSRFFSEKKLIDTNGNTVGKWSFSE